MTYHRVHFHRHQYHEESEMHETHVHHHHDHHYRIELGPEVTDRFDAIDRALDLINTKDSIIMSQADDLNNAVTSLATAFSVEHDAVMVELDALAKLVANQADPALKDAASQAIANIAHITGTMATDAAALTASIPAATTVPPPVVTPPDVPPTVTPPEIANPVITDPNATPPSTPPADATTTV